MTDRIALPFLQRRSKEVYGQTEWVTTTERIHGLLLLTGDRLRVQWRAARETERYGEEWRTDEEVDPVCEATVPIGALAGARVLRTFWRRLVPSLVLTAGDLHAFEAFGGEGGLRLRHPAEISVRIRMRDVPAALEFAGEVNHAIADLALRSAQAASELPLHAPPKPEAKDAASDALPKPDSDG